MIIEYEEAVSVANPHSGIYRADRRKEKQNKRIKAKENASAVD